MGKIVEWRKKKKKGRPSLLDLQKRSLKEQQQQREHHQPQPKRTPPNPSLKIFPIDPNPSRRSTRRIPNSDGVSPALENTEVVGDEDDELSATRRDKKLKVVLKLPFQRSSLNRTSLNYDSYNSDSNAKDDVAARNHKKRKINAIGDGSGRGHTEKEEKNVSPSKHTKVLQGTQSDNGLSAHLPDKKLLVFILDRLQKKDTYRVFSEPVDPNELPDYREVIENPMDFGTVRKKLASGAYSKLEQFEKDVFLICSNAMQYNAPDTVYFRQARSIQELAEKNFENLRHDSDNNEPERKIVRRGRPPTKNVKNQMLRTSLERAGSVFSDATLATGTEKTTWSNYDLKKGLLSDKSGPAVFSGRSFLGSGNGEPYSGLLAEHKFMRNDEFTGSILKGNGKKQVVFDDNRRNTYKQTHLSPGGREPSVLTTFNGQKKQLVAVGLHSEHGYARSLARFAANLGPVTWKVVSKKIEKSLPAGINFGPGWVGENVVVPPWPLVISSPAPVQIPFSLPGNSCKASDMEMIGDKSLEDPEREEVSEKKCMTSTHSDSDSHPSNKALLSPYMLTSSSPVVGNRSPETICERAEAVGGLSSHLPGPPFQILQNPVFGHGMNGIKGIHRFDFPAQLGKRIGTIRPCGINLPSSRIDNKISGCKEVAITKTEHQPKASWQEVSQQQKPDSVQPDLNIRFQAPGSPNSSRVDSSAPDLALQL